MAYISVPNNFVNGQVADANKVNSNFSSIINGLSDGTKDLNISKLDISTINIPSYATAPTSPDTGSMYINTTDGYLNYFDGTNWVPVSLSTDNNVVNVVDTVAELRTTSYVGIVYVRQYYTPYLYATDKDSGGIFIWDAFSTETDDSGCTISKTGIATGRWLRVHNGKISPRFFGAIGSGTNDDRNAIYDANEYCYSKGYILSFDAGTYLIGSALTISSNFEVFPGAILKYDSYAVTITGKMYGDPLYMIFNGGSSLTFSLDSVQHVRPEWWGLVSDGVEDGSGTDNTDSFSYAISATPEYGTLLIGPGSFNTTQLPIIYKSIHIKGYGVGTTRIIFDLAQTSSNAGFCFSGSIDDAVTVSSATEYDKYLSVSDASSFSVNDYVFIKDLKGYSSDAGTVRPRMQIDVIATIDSNDIYLKTQLEHTYDTTPTIQKVNMLENPTVSDLSIYEVTKTSFSGNIELISAPHLISFFYCNNPIIKNVSSENWQCFAAMYSYCIYSIAEELVGKNPTLITSGRGYLIRFQYSRFSHAKKCYGENTRHIVDMTGGQDVISESNIGISDVPGVSNLYQSTAFLTHGLLEKRYRSINDTIQGNSSGWSAGNGSFVMSTDFYVEGGNCVSSITGINVQLNMLNAYITNTYIKSSIRAAGIYYGATNINFDGCIFDCSLATSDISNGSLYGIADYTNPVNGVTINNCNITGSTNHDYVVFFNNLIGKLVINSTTINGTIVESGIYLGLTDLVTNPKEIYITNNKITCTCERSIEILSRSADIFIVNNNILSGYATSGIRIPASDDISIKNNTFIENSVTQLETPGSYGYNSVYEMSTYKGLDTDISNGFDSKITTNSLIEFKKVHGSTSFTGSSCKLNAETNGGTAIEIKDFASSGTIKSGAIFTISGVATMYKVMTDVSVTDSGAYTINCYPNPSSGIAADTLVTFLDMTELISLGTDRPWSFCERSSAGSANIVLINTTPSKKFYVSDPFQNTDILEINASYTGSHVKINNNFQYYGTPTGINPSYQLIKDSGSDIVKQIPFYNLYAGNGLTGSTYNGTSACTLTLSNLTSSGIFKITNCPDYATNASAIAGSMSTGMIYQSSGTLKIVT